VASRQAVLGGVVLTLALAIPATANAATVAPVAPCVRYIPGLSTLGVTSSGWAPNAALTFKVGDAQVGTGTADAAGNFTTPAENYFSPPAPKGNLEGMTLSAEDGAGGVATAPMKIVRLTVAVPDRARPSQRVKYRAFGFTPGKRLYLFVRRGKQTKGRFYLGKPKGDCGIVTKRLRYMPLKSWTTGTYEYWFGHSKTYSKKTRITGYQITITRVPG
jgi:hypothetical protein